MKVWMENHVKNVQQLIFTIHSISEDLNPKFLNSMLRSNFSENFKLLRLQHIEDFRKMNEMNDKLRKSLDRMLIAQKAATSSQLKLIQSYENNATNYLPLVNGKPDALMASFSTYIQNLKAKYNEGVSNYFMRFLV